MPREATTTTQPSRPRTGRRAGDQVVGATGLLEVQPEAVAVFDSFQAASHLNKASNTVWRRELARPPRSGDDTLKGTRYQWLRSHADPGSQKARDFHPPLQQDLQKAKAWALKENFRRIWSYRSVAGAMRFAHDWAGAVANARLRPMITTAETVKRHLWSIAGSVTHPITTSGTEKVHSIVQCLRHRARGLPSFASPSASVRFHTVQFHFKPS